MARRSNGTGSVYQRKDGSYVAQYNGTYRYAKTEEAAYNKLAKLLAGGEESKPSNVTVGTILGQYMEYARQNLKPRTVERYRYAIDTHLIATFGSTKLADLSVLQIEDAYTRLCATQAPSTIALLHAVLSSAVKRAVRLGYVQTNVCRLVKLPRIDKDDEVEVFGPEEVRRILSAAKYSPLEALWVLALTTGARQGEILGLQAQDYDADAGTLDIRRSIWKGQSGTPKSKQGKRKVVLPEISRAALDRHTSDSHWLFTTARGNPYTASHLINYRWKPLLASAGVPYRNFHTARHTVASILLGKGLPIPAVAKYLGHTPQILLKVYGHCLPDQMHAIASAIDASI